MKRITEWFQKLRAFIDRPWYVPLVAVFAGLDLFVMVVPTDGLILSAYFGKTKRLWGPVLWVALGSALGALALAAVVQADLSVITDRLFSSVFHSTAWEATDRFLEKYGVFAVAMSALCPIPQQPAVLLAALAGMPLSSIFLAFVIGRFMKYAFFAWSVRHLPQLVLKILSRERMTYMILKNARKSKKGVTPQDFVTHAPAKRR